MTESNSNPIRHKMKNSYFPQRGIHPTPYLLETKNGISLKLFVAIVQTIVIKKQKKIR